MPETLSSAITSYWNARSQGYGCKHRDELDSASASEWSDRFRQLLPQRAGARVLDIGCGPGFFSILLARLGYEVTALDASAGMLEQARANAERYGVSIRFIQGDACRLPEDIGRFDAIVNRYLVWNLPEPQKAYDQWLKALVPGGTLVVCDGNHYLYQTDERYAVEHSDARGGPSHAEKYLQGVDVSVMERLATQLPLSSLERPYWDLEALRRLGANEVAVVKQDTETIKHPKTGADVELITEFVIAAKAA